MARKYDDSRRATWLDSTSISALVRAARDARFQHAERRRAGRAPRWRCRPGIRCAAGTCAPAPGSRPPRRPAWPRRRAGRAARDRHRSVRRAARTPRRLSDQPGAQVDAGHAHDGALDLVAVREQQLAQRAARGFARARAAQAGDDALLPLCVQGVEARDDGGRRPVAERAFQHVDGAGAPARPALLAQRVRLLGPANHLIEAIAASRAPRAPSS